MVFVILRFEKVNLSPSFLLRKINVLDILSQSMRLSNISLLRFCKSFVSYSSIFISQNGKFTFLSSSEKSTENCSACSGFLKIFPSLLTISVAEAVTRAFPLPTNRRKSSICFDSTSPCDNSLKNLPAMRFFRKISNAENSAS